MAATTKVPSCTCPIHDYIFVTGGVTFPSTGTSPYVPLPFTPISVPGCDCSCNHANDFMRMFGSIFIEDYARIAKRIASVETALSVLVVPTPTPTRKDSPFTVPQPVSSRYAAAGDLTVRDVGERLTIRPDPEDLDYIVTGELFMLTSETAKPHSKVRVSIRRGDLTLSTYTLDLDEPVFFPDRIDTDSET